LYDESSSGLGLAVKKEYDKTHLLYGKSIVMTGFRDAFLQEEIKKVTNKPFVLQDEKGVFNELNYVQMKKTMDLFVRLHSKKCDFMREGMKDENRIQGYLSRNVGLNRTINRYYLGEGLVESNPRT
jgi:hypothetical protein